MSQDWYEHTKKKKRLLQPTWQGQLNFTLPLISMVIWNVSNAAASHQVLWTHNISFPLMKDTLQHQDIFCPLFLNSSVFVLLRPLWCDKEAKDEIASSWWAIALVSQQFLTSVVSVSADCSLLMKCKVIQSILIYMSWNHTCSRTELLERQIIYFVSSLHEMSVCILLKWEPFFM